VKASWFSRDSGNEFAVFLHDTGETVTRDTALIPITADYSVWAWVREEIRQAEQQQLARMAYVREGNLSDAGLRVIRAGQEAMRAAKVGDRVSIEVAYDAMAQAGAPMEMGAVARSYWIERWLKNRW